MSLAPTFKLPDSIYRDLHSAPFGAILELWRLLEQELGPSIRPWLSANDRFYLLVRTLHRIDCVHPWIYARTREVEKAPDGYLDLWARDHYKSTIITFGGIIQEVLRNPEITVGIFSHTKPIAKAFLRQIQKEFEANEDLRSQFPHIFFEFPHRNSPSWSLDNGITVQRKNNPKENTVEAWGLVDGQPVSKHFALMVYDDVVTQDSVNTPDQVDKTTKSWQLSDNLLSAGGRKWHIGTRYSYADTYEVMLKQTSVIPRIYPATDDGTISGNPVFLSTDVWRQKVKDQGEAIISCQMLQNPLAGQQRMFNVDNLGIYEVRPEVMNVYVTVDPARSRKKGSDNTAITVIGVDYALNKYLLDGYNHKMDLRERWLRTSQMYHKWKRAPGVQMIWVGYEAYGAQADLDYFEERMADPREGGHFPIMELRWPNEGDGSKTDRVQRLGPDIRTHKFFLPYDTDEKALTSTQRKFVNTGYQYRLAKPIRRTDGQGNIYDLSREFRMQIHYFPFGGRKDVVDAASRIYDMEPKAPSYNEPGYLEPDYV